MKLSEAQRGLLSVVNEDGYRFVSGAKLRTARSLADRGLVTMGSRNVRTGAPCPPWTKHWCNTAERLEKED